MPYVYETWDIGALQDLVVCFTRQTIKQHTMKRLIRYINYHLYDNPRSKHSISAMINSVKNSAAPGLTDSVNIAKEMKELGGAMIYLNPVIIRDIMETKECPVNKITVRGILWKMYATLSYLIDRFLREGGLDANKDYWLQRGKRD